MPGQNTHMQSTIYARRQRPRDCRPTRLEWGHIVGKLRAADSYSFGAPDVFPHP